MIKVVFSLVFVVVAFLFLLWNRKKRTEKKKDKKFEGNVSDETLSPSSSKEVEEKKKDDVKKSEEISTKNLSWEEETTKYLKTLQTEDQMKFLLLKILDDSSHYVIPSVHEIDSNSNIDFTGLLVSSFERFVFQPAYHPLYETMFGVVRFNDRCTGPCIVNDNLKFDAVNGGATLSFAMEMMQYFGELKESSIFLKKSDVWIPFSPKTTNTLEEVEIEYIKPIPIKVTHKFSCLKDRNNRDKLFVEISDFNLGSRKSLYSTVTGNFFKDDDEEDFDDMYLTEKKVAEFYQPHFAFIQKDEFPPEVEKLLESYEKDSEYEFVHVTFYDSNFPKEKMKNVSGLNNGLPKYFLASQNFAHCYGRKDLLKFKYANIVPYYCKSRNETHCFLYFGEETLDMNEQIHQGVIATVLDNYGYLHQAKSVPVHFNSYTRILKIKYFKEYQEIQRFQFLKMFFYFTKDSETKIDGNRRVIHAHVTGKLTSLDEKKTFTQFSSIFTSVEPEV